LGLAIHKHHPSRGLDRRRRRLVWATCVLSALAPMLAPVNAQQTDRWRFRQFQLENDYFPVPGTEYEDRFYTNGIRISLGKGLFEPGDDAQRLPFWLRPVRDRCASCSILPNFSLGHQIYTPEDIGNPDPQPGDRPWAAWLYAGFGAALDTADDTRHDIELQIGVTGDAAGGEPAQRIWHDIAGGPEALGWDNQLGPELGINAYYNLQHILWSAEDERAIDWDFVPSVKAAAGTMMTYVGVGGTLRIGRDITDFPYSPIRPSERSVSADVLPNLGIYGFVGVDFRAVAHNYFLEGSLFRDEALTVEPKRFVRDLHVGVTARFRHYNLTYAIVRRSEEFERTVGTDSGIHTFTSLSLTVGLR
jgi:hypothetical protein